MNSFYAPCRRWLRAVVIVGVFGFYAECCASEAPGQPPRKLQDNKSTAHPPRDVRSRHFVLHTDLSADEADKFVERLESMVGPMASYWGRPPRGMIECYVIRNADGFPAATTDHAAVRAVKTVGGATLMQFAQDGKRQVAKSAMYAAARLEVVQHEAVHAYCHQTFGRVGPVWYSEGMAEVGRFWNEGDTAVCAEPREIAFLRNHPPKSLAESVAPGLTGDSWQKYASRRALCHFLTSNPNYSRQFRKLGRAILSGKESNLEQAYGEVTRQLFFEYLLFLKHIDRGYRVDLCAWDWRKKFSGVQAGQLRKATIAAGHGWQATGLTVRSGESYEYVSEGTWQVGREATAVDARGHRGGRGRLVGALLKNFRLGPEFELGTEGSFQLASGGDLYLRCRNAWSELADNQGQITVTVQHPDEESPL